MTDWSEWPIKPPKTLRLDHPVPPEKARMDAVYEARISPVASASEAFDIGWYEGRDAARIDMEELFWQIVDRNGLASLPSDMWAALEQIARPARQRDMRKCNCERQAEHLERKP